MQTIVAAGSIPRNVSSRKRPTSPISAGFGTWQRIATTSFSVGSTAASASEGAKAQGFTIPGNPVVGVFRNDFARRMLAASLPAGIEAPIRFYVTENADGATLSWRTPSAVFAPYVAAGGAELKKIADELDPIFARIGEDATKP